MSPAPILSLDRVTRTFPARSGGAPIKAVHEVSLALSAGETLGLVGESGSGKSTTGRLALGLLKPTSGTVAFEGQDLDRMSQEELFQFRRQAQIIFQDPFSSLNPRMTVYAAIAEPLRIHRIVSRAGESDEVYRLLRQVGLRPEHARRYPFQFSGGQRQRISIARAISVRPRLVVADEAVSSLDVSVQAQIINLLRDLQENLGLALLFISHNLAVVRHLCHRTVVMKGGQIVESALTEELFTAPQQEYTRLLLSSILDPDPARHRRRAGAGGSAGPVS